MLMYWNCYIDTWNFERIQFILFIWFFPAFEQHKCIRRCQSHRRLKAKVLSRGKMVSVSWLLCLFSHFKRVFVRFNDCYNSINTSSFLYVVECFIIWRVVDLFSCTLFLEEHPIGNPCWDLHLGGWNLKFSWVVAKSAIILLMPLIWWSWLYQHLMWILVPLWKGTPKLSIVFLHDQGCLAAETVG